MLQGCGTIAGSSLEVTKRLQRSGDRGMLFSQGPLLEIQGLTEKPLSLRKRFLSNEHAGDLCLRVGYVSVLRTVCGELHGQHPVKVVARFGQPVVADSVAGFVGPLAGVLAGMDWAAAQGYDAVLSVAGDTPFFPNDLAAQLVAALGQAPIAMATGPGGGRQARHPTFALWRVELRAALRAELEAGLRKVVAFSHEHGCVDVEFPDEAAFFNVNTPEELAVAQARMEAI